MSTPVTTSIELNGAWTDGSPRKAVISVKGDAITINMSAFNRPAAHGAIVDGSRLTATFPDDRTYIGELEPPNRIRWSNGSVWTKLVRALIDLSGRWTDGSPRHAVIFADDTTLKIDMSDFGRPTATGSILDISTIRVKFPDEATHTGTLHPPRRIEWDNNSTWTKV
ncbi:hypothetical protein ACRCUN_26900 [Mycobacterium sp. LTG2003]